MSLSKQTVGIFRLDTLSDPFYNRTRKNILTGSTKRCDL